MKEVPIENQCCAICKNRNLSEFAKPCYKCDGKNFVADYDAICKWCYNPVAPGDNICEEHRKSHTAHSWPDCIAEDQKKQLAAHEIAEKKARRERIATACLTALLNNPIASEACEYAIRAGNIARKDWFAKQAIDFADALIDALDKVKE